MISADGGWAVSVRYLLFSAFLIRLASRFSCGVRVGAFLTFFFASWLLLMDDSPSLEKTLGWCEQWPAALSGSAWAEKMVIYNNQVVLFFQNAHPLPMAKTWISKRDVKAEKAFIKAMRLLSPKAGRRQFSRPR
jgi:hypothetical protein